MSLERLENYLDKTEAVERYDKIKEENDRLKIQLGSIQNQLKKVQGEFSKYKALKVRLGGKDISLEAFERKIEEQTLKIYQEEIEKKSLERYKAEVPALAKRELDRVLKLPGSQRPKALNNLLGEKVNEKLDHILKTPFLWPPWFKQLKEQEVNTGIANGLTETFWGNVQVAINNAKHKEWPRFLDEYIQNTITPFCQQVVMNQLTNPNAVEKACDKCGTVMTVTLAPDHIAELIKRPYILVDCLNPQCKDFLRRHRIRITLGDVIIQLVGRPNRSAHQNLEREMVWGLSFPVT